jgi:hypothetical protein
MSRQFAPATQRNRGPILEVLREVLPAQGLVLEVASGSGEHAIHFAAELPELEWQPSDPDADARTSITAWLSAAGNPTNIRPPLDLDVHRDPWPLHGADAVVCINMLHIAPWSACSALFQGAGRLLPEAGVLYLYGPYKRDAKHTAPSNAAFDRDLRLRNPAWGVRDLADVESVARAAGLGLTQILPMPANNLSLVFRKPTR